MDYARILHHASPWTELTAADSLTRDSGTAQAALVRRIADSHAAVSTCADDDRTAADSFLEYQQWTTAAAPNNSTHHRKPERTTGCVCAGCKQSRRGQRNGHGQTRSLRLDRHLR